MADGEKRELPKLSTQKSRKSEFPFLKFVEKLIYCQVCLKYEEKIKVSKNYNASFVVGSNFRKSAVSGHSQTEMHRKAEELEKIENAEKLGEKYKKKAI